MGTIDQLIKDYKPNLSTVELVRSTEIALLAGITGAGKDTIKKELLKQSKYHDIVSHTTRKPRTNGELQEKDGIDYHFVNQLTAEKMIKNHQFVEAKLVHGDVIYGTSVAEIQIAHDDGRIAITDIDVQGVREYIKISNNIIPIFITPPNHEIWISRLMHRYQSQNEFDLSWPKRRNSAIMELTVALDDEKYQFVVNSLLSDAVQSVDEIVLNYSSRRLDDKEARLVALSILAALKKS